MNVDEKKILEETERIYYLYEDYAQRKVYLYNKEEKKDQLIYDFTLNIADKLPMSPEFELKEISEIFNLDQKRKQYIFVNEHNDSIVWIEGIGNYTDLVNSIALKRPYYKRVLCVKKNEKTIYETEKIHGYNCTDIEEKRGYAGIELPNNIGIISIKDNNLIAFAGVTGVVLISIFDYSGQCVLQTRDTTIDVSRLPEGIYILQAVTADGQVLQDKFIRTK